MSPEDTAGLLLAHVLALNLVGGKICFLAAAAAAAAASAAAATAAVLLLVTAKGIFCKRHVFQDVNLMDLSVVLLCVDSLVSVSLLDT